MTAQVTIALEDNDKAQLQTIADFRKQSVEAVVSDAVRQLIDYDAWFRAEVEKGLKDVREGRTIAHEQVVARAMARHAARKDASQA